jgi:hypothetical protein
MTLQKGHVLQGRYRIVKLLGQGGMGAVYRAWDVRLNVPVALKEMTPQPGLDVQTLTQLCQQFEQEANILARMKHPHLVHVTDFFEEAGNAYLVMDFVEGESLADCIAREGALDEAQVLVWAEQLLDALATCHGEGVIHRDVKPQNVVITPQGGAVLVDFGLVKLWDPDDPHTRTAMRGMGTPEYAPPEQYDTYTGHTGPQSDIYGVGATLYHALTGQAPPTVTQRTASRSVFKPPRALNPRISRQTEAAILRAMALFVEDRFSTAGDMAVALRDEARALRGGVVAPPLRYPPPTRVISGRQAAASSRRRVLVTWVLLSVAALAVLAVCVGLIWGTLAGGGAATVVTPTARATVKPSITKLPPTLTATPSKTPRPTVEPTASDGVIYRPGKFGKGASLCEGFTELVTNPSFEVDLTGWTYTTDGAGGGQSRITTDAKFGSACNQITRATGGMDCYSYSSVIAVSASTNYALSCYCKQLSGTGALQLGVHWYTAGDVYISYSAISDFPSGTHDWVRRIGVLESPAMAAKAYIIINVNGVSDGAVVNVDAVNFVESDYGLPYRDGSMPGTDWDGTEHDSTTTVTAAQLYYDGFTGDEEQGSVSFWWQPSYDYDDTLDEFKVLWRWYATSGARNDILIWQNQADNKLCMSAYKDDVLQGGSDGTPSWSAGDWLLITLTWDWLDAGEVILYVNGAELCKDTSIGSAPQGMDRLIVGAFMPETNISNGTYDDLAVFDRALTPAEIQALYASGQPLLPPSPDSVDAALFYAPFDGDAWDVVGGAEPTARATAKPTSTSLPTLTPTSTPVPPTLTPISDLPSTPGHEPTKAPPPPDF